MMGLSNTVMFVFYSCIVLFGLLCVASKDETWTPVASNVCFGSKGKTPGTFKLKQGGFVQGIRLKHVSGGVSCNKDRKDFMSKFGCYVPDIKGQIGVFVSDEDDNVILPLEMKSKHYALVFSGGNAANSTTVTFYDDLTPLFYDSGTGMKLWYMYDYMDRSGNNVGTSCVDVSVLYAS